MVKAESIAVVTGASGGVGSALCAELARRGLRVLALGRDAERLELCRQHDPARIECIAADLSVDREREQAVSQVLAHGRIHYLVHAAATVHPVVSAEALSEEAFRRAQAINVEAPVFFSLRLSASLSGGRILHVSSGAAHTPLAGCLSYCTSKAALHMAYRVLQLELAPRGIRVGSASPGSVDTPMQTALRSARVEDFPERARFQALSEDKRLLLPERSAHFLCWLLLDSTDEIFTERDWNLQDGSLTHLWDVAR